ncbi:MAG: GH3 auxin-responsive promoter family protein, partial [Chitinophagaceae bacterium]|nr:GH3 auxin-responsive promoter family protein [Chitinophagaceae bacterium]
QDTLDEEGLLLNTNSGIYFEFIPADEIYNEQPTRLSLKDVQTGVNYALIINSNAGLWGYNIGDTVRFVSTDPYRLVVTGRTKHFISAFGEHVIGEEVEYAMLQAAQEHNAHIIEFTVAPKVQTDNELPYHEWFVEFETVPDDLEAFSMSINNHLREKNSYYEDLISGAILQPLKIRSMQKHGFIEYMKSQGKLGGQNKVPRLSNDRKIADAIQPWIQN